MYYHKVQVFHTDGWGQGKEGVLKNVSRSNIHVGHDMLTFK